MDLYGETQSYLMSLPGLQGWPEAQELIQQFYTHRPRHWQLPVEACLAVGGTATQAIPGMAAIAALYMSIILIDDMLDADPKGKYHELGEPATANLAVALQAVGLEAIARGEHSAAIKFAVSERLNQMGLATALGQYWDVQNPQEEEAYWRVMHAKSAPFFGAALQIGALMGGASAQTAMQMHTLGSLYGEIIQIHDDLSDVMETPANPDWILGRSPLPILYAQVAPHPQHARFLELRQTISDATALAEAQAILIQCGAISYSVDQLLRRAVKAKTILTEMTLSEPARITILFEQLVAPVHELFATVGATQPNSRIASIPLQLVPEG